MGVFRFELLIATALLAALASAPLAADTQADTAAAITRLGGTITFDEAQAGRPVTAVSLYEQEAAPEPLALIAKLTSIEVLRIGGDIVTDDSLAQLEALTHLKSLFISSRALTDAGLPHLAKLPALRELNLRCSTKLTDQGLAHLGKLKHVEKLALYMHATADGIASLKGMTALRELNLSNMQLDGACIAKLRNLPNLRVLILTSVPVNDGCLNDLAEMTQLEKLDLRRTRISAASIVGLQKALPRCEILR